MKKVLFRLSFILISAFVLNLCKVYAITPVSYVTDLEGSKTRFLQFMANSGSFYLGADGLYHVKNGTSFVFGGDAPDRFLGAKWIVEELLRLKRESPDQVILIAGNRDINKIRLRAELSPEALEKTAYRYHFINAQDPEWLATAHGQTMAERLKFIFKRTMGAPAAFELRRQELALPSGTNADAIVAQSFYDELAPHGAFAQMLAQAQLAWRSDNTLFVHGGVTIENLGRVPTLKNKIENIDQWISSLNHWYKTEVNQWLNNPQSWSGTGPRPAELLLDYPMSRPGQRSRPDSVVCARNSNDKNEPLLPSPEVIKWLTNQGIHRVVLGHTPTGHVPVFLRTIDGNFEIISADNSHVAEKHASQIELDGRGLSTAMARGTAIDEDGKALPVYAVSKIGEPSLLGLRAPDGSLIIGRQEDAPGMWVTFQYGDGFKIINRSVSEDYLQGHCENLLNSISQKSFQDLKSPAGLKHAL